MRVTWFPIFLTRTVLAESGLMHHVLQVAAMQQGNHRLLGHCRRLERQKDLVMAQVQAMQDKWAEAESMRSHLQNEASTLRKTCEVCVCMPNVIQAPVQG